MVIKEFFKVKLENRKKIKKKRKLTENIEKGKHLFFSLTSEVNVSNHIITAVAFFWFFARKGIYMNKCGTPDEHEDCRKQFF